MDDANRERARQWYKAHRQHVNDMLREWGPNVEPQGSDATRPEIWKPMHWRWIMIGEVVKHLAQHLSDDDVEYLAGASQAAVVANKCCRRNPNPEDTPETE